MHSKMEHSSLKCVKVLLQPLWLKTLTMYITSMGCLRYYIAIWNKVFEKSEKYIQHFCFLIFNLAVANKIIVYLKSRYKIR